MDESDLTYLLEKDVKTLSSMELQDIVQQLRRLAFTDPLTNIGNYRLFEQKIGLTNRGANSVQAVLLFDVDQFGRINKTFGQMAGDRILRLIAKTIVCYTKEAQGCFRVGGDEFALLIAAKDENQALYLARKCLYNVNVHLLSETTAPTYITLSGGYATISSDIGCENFLEKASQRLIMAKRAGLGMFCYDENKPVEGLNLYSPTASPADALTKPG